MKQATTTLFTEKIKELSNQIKVWGTLRKEHLAVQTKKEIQELEHDREILLKVDPVKQLIYIELKEAVQEMREEQKAYFRTRDYNHLNRSKEFEKKVDQIIKNLNSDATEQRLF